MPKVLLRAGVVGADPGRSHDRWVPAGDLPTPGASLLDDLPGAGPQRRTGGRPGGASPATCRSDALATEAGPGAGGAVAQEMTPRQPWSDPNPGRRLRRGPRPAVVVPGREHRSAVVAQGSPAGTTRGGLSGGGVARATWWRWWTCPRVSGGPRMCRLVGAGPNGRGARPADPDASSQRLNRMCRHRCPGRAPQIGKDGLVGCSPERARSGFLPRTRCAPARQGSTAPSGRRSSGSKVQWKKVTTVRRTGGGEPWRTVCRWTW